VAGCGGVRDSPSADAVTGREVFASASCGACHTYAAAGATGTSGPNLDEANISRPRAIEVVRHGAGAMPGFSDQLTEAQIRAVAEFVSR
jgi:mono/diheme cytochrome c family protein